MTFDNSVQKMTIRVGVSFLFGLVMTFVLALPFRLPLLPLSLDSILFWILPLASLSLLVYLFWPFAGRTWKLLSTGRFWALVLLVCVAASWVFVSWPPVFFMVCLASFSVLFLYLAYKARRGFIYALERKIIWRILAAWLLGACVAFWPIGFLAHFYLLGYQFVFVSSLAVLLCGLGSYYLLGRMARALQHEQAAFWVEALVAGMLFIAILAAFQVGARAPNLFDPDLFRLPAGKLPLFLLSALFTVVWLPSALAILHEMGVLSAFCRTRLAVLLEASLPGLLLATLFTALYFVLSTGLNSFQYDLDENVLASDSSSWIARLSALDLTPIRMRAVHPLAYLIFRPLVAFTSLFLNGNRAYAALLANAFAGGTAVLFAWLFVRRMSGQRSYAALIASLLGASTAHLVFGAVVETYIFSAALLLLFCLLLQNEQIRLPGLVAAGVAIFGVTVTNLLQTLLGLFAVRPNAGKLIRYLVLVVAISVVLNFVTNLVYPNTSFFFQPGKVSGTEAFYTKNYLRDPAWRIVGRAYSLTRHVLLYSVVAPEPFFMHREAGYEIPRAVLFDVSRENYHSRKLGGLAGILDDARQIYRPSKYVGIGKWTEYLWVVVLAVGSLLAVWKFIRKPSWGLPVAFVLCLGFNFGLHFFYGSDPSLYLAHWAYALVLFIAMGWEHLAGKKWLHLVLLVLLALLLVNNLTFVGTILTTLNPYMPR